MKKISENNTTRNTKFIFGALIIVFSLVAIDQIIKSVVIKYLKPIETVDFIDGFLRFHYIENTGAVFGSFSTYTALLTVVSIVLLAITVYFLFSQKNQSKLVSVTLLLMISGGIGNIIDRIRLHYVVDYIEPLFIDFAVFNFADCLITVGAFVLMIYLIIDIIKDTENQKKDKNKNDFLADEVVSEDETN